MVDKLTKLLLIISIVVFGVSAQSGAAAFERELSPGWNFVSLPFSPSGTAPASFLKIFDSSNSQKLAGVRMLGIENGGYADSEAVPAHFHGRGYLIYSPGAYRLKLDGEETSTAAPVSVSLKKGWNLIGTPYNAEVSWDSDITIDGAALTLATDKIDAKLYEYDAQTGTFSTARVFEGKLEPWKAYFVKAKKDCVMTLAAGKEAGRGTIVSVNIDGLGAQRVVSGEVVVSLTEGAAAGAAISKIESLGGVVTKSNAANGLYLVAIPAGADAAKFSSDMLSTTGVDSAVPNIVLSSTDLTPDDPPYTAAGDAAQRWAFEKINAPRAWATAAYAAQPLIAVIDTGVDAANSDLAGRVLGGKSFVGLTATTDTNGHGTHAAGIIAAAGNNSQGIAGVCWQCRILPVQTCDAAGNCPLFSVLDGLAYASEQGAKIINISLSGYAPAGSAARKIFQSAVNRAAAPGAIIIGAAGNGSQDAGDTVPAGLNNTLAVTAVDSADGRPSFANYGAAVDIAAPGENIYSLLPSGGAGMKSGTSAAAAFVSGAAGLLMSQNPALSANDAAAALLSTAAAISFSPAISGGRLDIGAAMDPVRPANLAPVISDCRFTPDAIPSDGTAGASLICDVTDPENKLASVSADLTAIGGGSPASLVNSGGSAWAINYISAGAGTPPGDYEIAIKAADSEGASAVSTAALAVAAPPNGIPVVTNCDFLPHGLAPDGVTQAAVTVKIGDSDGADDVSAVTIDLSQIGGSSSALMYDDGLHGDGAAGDGYFGLAGITIPVNSPQGVFELTVTATDRAADNGTGYCVVGVNASLSPQAACTTDWPRFHCNTEGSGEATGYTITTPLSTLWTYTIGDAILSSPVIDAVSGRLFITNGVGGSGVDKTLYILNPDTGALIQACPMGGSTISTPAVSGNKVYAGGGNDNFIYAFNALDCLAGPSPLWKVAAGGNVYSSPLVYGGNVFIGADDSKIYALDANTGATAWGPTAVAGIVRSIPAGDAGNIYFAGGSGIYAKNALTGAAVWTTFASSAITASAVIAGGRVFIGDTGGGFYALNENTGAIIWKYTATSNIYSSAAAANGNVYFVSNSGVAYALSQAAGAVVWSRNLGPATEISSPAVVDGKIIFELWTPASFVVLKESDGSVLQNTAFAGGLTSSPAIYNNRVYFGGWDKKVYCMAANIPPAVGAVTFTPNTLLADGYATTTVTAVISDANGLSDIASVTVNLSQLGGAASTTLYDDGTNGDATSGDGIYTRRNITASATTTAGAKTLTVTAVDSNAASATGNGALTITANTAPVITSCSFSPAAIAANGAATTVLTCAGISDADSNLQSVTANLTSIGGSATAALTFAGAGSWQRSGITAASGTAAATYTITTTATDIAGATGTRTAALGITSANTAPTVSACSFSPASVPANASTTTTLTCAVTDAENNVSTVTANLTSIGGGAASALTFVAGSTWRRTGVTAAIGTAIGAYTITTTATDASAATGTATAALTVTDPPPAVSSCAFSPTSIAADGSATATLQCTVTDANGNLSTVTANLASIGGGAATALTNSGGNIWQKTGITAPIGTAPATYTITITSTDAAAGVGTGTASLGVTDPAPAVSTCSFTPTSVTANGSATATLNCTVTDLNNNVTGVTVNLTSIGGGAAIALTNMGAGAWQKTGITAAFGTAAATYTLAVTATDASAGTGTGPASLGVTSPPVNFTPAVSGVGFSPSSALSNGAAVFTATASVTDANGLSDIAGVTIDLSTIGGSAAAVMYDDGAHGDGAASDGVFGATSTVASSTVMGSYSLTVTAYDAAAASGSANAALTVTTPNNPPVISSCVFTPNPVSGNGATYTGLSCLVSDPEANVLTVTADLSAVGGSSAEPLNALGTGYFETASFTIPLGTTPATYTIAVSATDTVGATGTATAALGVTSVNPWYVQSCADQPAGHWLPLNNPGMVNMPRDATVSDNDDIYIADTGNHRVAQFDKNCVFIRNWGYLGNADGNFKSPTGIVFNPVNNYIYVADYYDRVQYFNKTGVFVNKITVYKPSSVAVDSSGNIYVTSRTYNLVSKFDTSGTLTATWTVTAPLGIDLDASGNIYVSQPASGVIVKIDPSSGATSTIGSPGSGNAQFNDPRGIAIDTASGTIFVADYGNNRIEELTLAGAYVQEFNQYGAGPGQVNYPEGAAMTNSGNLLLLDTLNSRLQEFRTIY